MEDSQWPALIEAAGTLTRNQLIIIDKPKYKYVEDFAAFCESIALRNKISLVVADHIQLMRTRERINTRKDRVDAVSEKLQDLAKNLNVPVLVLCQLNREIEKTRDGKAYPRLDHMKESGDLEQNADNVWGLWRADKGDEMARLEGLKGRDVGTWVTWLRFDRYIQRFYDTEEQYEIPAKVTKVSL